MSRPKRILALVMLSAFVLVVSALPALSAPRLIRVSQAPQKMRRSVLNLRTSTPTSKRAIFAVRTRLNRTDSTADEAVWLADELTRD